MSIQVEGGELQSALQYQVLSTGLQHGHLVMVGGVQHQQWCMLPLEKQVGHARPVYRYVCTVQQHRQVYTECISSVHVYVQRPILLAKYLQYTSRPCNNQSQCSM